MEGFVYVREYLYRLRGGGVGVTTGDDCLCCTGDGCLLRLASVLLVHVHLNRSKVDSVQKCIIKCLYQLIFKFSQLLDFQLAYLLNYC
jgi:hypothetical protein